MLFCELDIVNINYELLVTGNKPSSSGLFKRALGKAAKMASPLIDRNRSNIVSLLQSKIIHAVEPYGVHIDQVHGRDLIEGEEKMLKIDLTINEIDYHQLIEYLVPKIMTQKAGMDPKLSAVIKTLQGYDHMPQKMLIAALDTLSETEKNQMIQQLFQIYKSDIMNALSKQEWSKAVDIRDIYIHEA